MARSIEQIEAEIAASWPMSDHYKILEGELEAAFRDEIARLRANLGRTNRARIDEARIRAQHPGEGKFADAVLMACDERLAEGKHALREAEAEITRLREALRIFSQFHNGGARFALGQRVRKFRGSSWQGHIVGFYHTGLTPIGYAVESERETGSVQIYPESALELVEPKL